MFKRKKAERIEPKRVGYFEKVPYDRFRDDMKDCFPEMTESEIVCAFNSTGVPRRGTAGSAGYDFKTPVDIELKPGESIKIPTAMRVIIENGWFLACVPRSGLGFKYRCQLDNTVGIIDSDYSHSENLGHIFAKITNDSKDGKVFSLKMGDRFMQGIFLPYGITLDDTANADRTGGFGSTGK